jgi:signal transduction histidine kinase
LRAAGDGVDVTLRFPLASAARLRELDAGRVDPHARDVGSGLALFLARRVSRRMGGALTLRQLDRQGELRLALPGDAPVEAVRPADGGAPDLELPAAAPPAAGFPEGGASAAAV